MQKLYYKNFVVAIISVFFIYLDRHRGSPPFTQPANMSHEKDQELQELWNKMDSLKRG